MEPPQIMNWKGAAEQAFGNNMNRKIGMGPAQAKVQRVKISPEAVDPEDIETLEDLVVAAVNEALSKAQKVAADKLGPLTGGLKLPGM